MSRLETKLDELIAAIQALEADIEILQQRFPSALDAQGRLKVSSGL